jgi:hypothetical protein
MNITAERDTLTLLDAFPPARSMIIYKKEKYYLWFDKSYCPTIPVDLYSAIPECVLEFDRYPLDCVDWSNVYWQGTYSDFPDEDSYSTIGIRYTTAGVYSVALSDTPEKSNAPLSDPFIDIADASVSVAFFNGIETTRLSERNLGVSLIIMLIALAALFVQGVLFVRRKGVSNNHNHES